MCKLDSEFGVNIHDGSFWCKKIIPVMGGGGKESKLTIKRVKISHRDPGSLFSLIMHMKCNRTLCAVGSPQNQLVVILILISQ